MESSILIVDDNKDAADAMAKLLGHLGFKVAVVYSGKEALKLMPTYKPTVVLLDIRMPELDGYAVAKKIRSKTQYKNTILVALTGFGRDEDKLLTNQAGFNHHLTKPASLSDLREILDVYLPLEKKK